MTSSEAAELEARAVTPSRVAGSMAQHTDKRGGKPRRRMNAAPTGDALPPSGVDQAFELWLNRGLHQLYDAVAQEPVPDELLRLLEQDRTSPHK